MHMEVCSAVAICVTVFPAGTVALTELVCTRVTVTAGRGADGEETVLGVAAAVRAEMTAATLREAAAVGAMVTTDVVEKLTGA